VTTLQGLAQSYRSGARLFNYCPEVSLRDDDALAEQHVDVIEFLDQIPGEKIVVHDEAQSYQSGAVGWCLSQGGNLDSESITSLVLTQRPWNLPEEWRANMPVKIWVGPVTSEGRKFFKVEEMRDAIAEVERKTRPYHWAVTDGGEFQHVNSPVSEEYT
jgi:hypothetical protein